MGERREEVKKREEREKSKKENRRREGNTFSVKLYFRININK